jgi:hypothetical protein
MKTCQIRGGRRVGLWPLALVQLGLFISPALAADAPPPADPPVWARRYKEGEKFVYRMKATNRGRQGTLSYEAQANGVVKKDAQGKFYEEFAWSNLVVNKAPMALAPASASFRQVLALPPDVKMAIPDLSRVQPILIGPITDLMTFYADMVVAAGAGGKAKAGDHFYFKHGAPSSWADGVRVVTGEDSVDFEVTVKEIDRANQTATILVRHVPPEKPRIKLAAEWMRAPVADSPNNWVEVTKTANGKFVAAVGKETFDVQIKASLVDGRILSAREDNPVDVLERECADAALTQASSPVRYQIRRQIEIYGQRGD